MTWYPRNQATKRSDPNVTARIIASTENGYLIEAQWPNSRNEPETNILVVSREYWRQRYEE